MDKNMINIDELVRDRLSGGEDGERTGAWLQMRELLDKRMPVEAPPVGFGWKRITGYIAGVVLLAALSVGSYKTMTTHGSRDTAGNTTDNTANTTAATNGDHTTLPADNGNLAATTHDAAGTNGIGGNPNSTTLNNYGQDNNTVRPANNNRNNNNNNNNNRNSGNNRNHTAAAHNGGNNAGHDLTANAVHGAGNPIIKSEQLGGPDNNAAANTDNSAANSTTAHTNTAGRTHTTDASGNNTGTANIGASAGNNVKNNTTAAHSVQPHNPEATQRRHNGATTGTPSGAAATTSGNTTGVATAGSNTPAGTAMHNPDNNRNNNTGNHAANTAVNNTGNNNNNPAPVPALKKDTIEKIRLVQHYNRRRAPGTEPYRMDTIGIEQMIVSRPAESATAATGTTPAPSLSNARRSKTATTQKDPATYTMAPAASTTAAKANAGLEADAGSNLVLLSNYRVASRKLNWDPQRFEEMVYRFKYKLAQLKFYPGMVAGINASMFGPNSFGGFQLGLAGTLALNDRLSIAAELKYINRFNSGVSVNDNYAGKPSDSAAIYNAQGTALEYMSYTRDSMHHYFNFSMLNSVEMPVSVKYSIGRFFMMGGLNFAYHIKVNAEEVERKLITQTVVPYYHAPITWPEGKPTISNKDFNSRFEVGGVFGVGYEMTPAVQLDLRMTKAFWDNARTNGAKTVSDQLYRSPSLQLSIGYRFSQQKH